MKIVQINAVYGIGSTGLIVRDIQRACIQAGLMCSVVYSQANQKVPYGYHMGNVLSNKMHALMSRISGKQGYFSILSTWRMLRYLNSMQPDIVHLHNLHGCYINLPMLLRYLAKKNIKTVVSLHDCWFYTGGCSHYTAVGCERWKEHCGNCPRRYEEFPSLLWDSSRKQLADRLSLFGAISNLTVVGVSEWITEEAKQKVFCNSRCVTIHNGIDIEFFHPVNSGFREKCRIQNKFVILAPSNKWFLSANESTLDYFSHRLSDNIIMLFVGNGFDGARCSKNMINLGFISSREDLREIYSAADVLVNCTREDSLSLLNLEVQACGTPVVTYANTGVRETVDNSSGFAVENGSPEALWQAVLYIMECGKQHFSPECSRWVKYNFDMRKNYMEYLELYLTMCAC